MKCPDCATENRASVRFCKKCGKDLTAVPIWFPDLKWHLKTLSIIYLALIALYFSLGTFLKKLPPPYDQRILPAETTPWLYPHKIPQP